MQELDKLLKTLLAERPEGTRTVLPSNLAEKRKLLRALMNTRPPISLDPELLSMQDRELAAQLSEKGIVELADITPSPLYPKLRVWQGDITRLAVDAIVNAANSQMLGCFMPLHNCIDNAIHSAAGMQLREECNRQMQGGDEPAGQARITPGYNLPAAYVIHTVGPIVRGALPTERDKNLLASCYSLCLGLAEANNIKSIAFCCISTGVFGYPQEAAAKVAVTTALEYFDRVKSSGIGAVVFDVFKDKDLLLYRRLLGYQ